MPNVVVQARVSAELKQRTERIFSALGIDTATGIRIFLAQVDMHQGLPFDMTIEDPFYSPSNMRHLDKAIAEVKAGHVVEHDIIEVD